MKKDDPMRHVCSDSAPKRIMREQWWCGLVLLLLWAAIIMGVFFGCALANQ